MLVSFTNRKFAKQCEERRELERAWGVEQAKRISRRLAELSAAENLAQLRALPQIRAHELKGNRKGQISLDVKHPYRMIVEPAYTDPPRKPDTGLDWERITQVRIIAIEDTHE